MFLPHAIFFGVLLINTFFSVRFFSKLIKRDLLQWVVDIVLVCFYIVMLFALGQPLWFPFIVTAFFIVATLKYAVLFEVMPHPNLLKRKICIDLLGAAMGAAVLGGALMGYPREAAWAMAVVFVVANIYFLFIKPMYRM